MTEVNEQTPLNTDDPVETTASSDIGMVKEVTLLQPLNADSVREVIESPMTMDLTDSL